MGDQKQDIKIGDERMKRPLRIMQPGDYVKNGCTIDENLLWQAYCGDNYEIVDLPKTEGAKPWAVVYFSSNGLYDPSKNDFEKVVVSGKRFEWKKNKIKKASRHIFVRDVFLCSYFYGINHNIDSFMKLTEFLREKTAGYRVIMLGSSGGGYAAALAGSILQAEAVYSFSGQFDILKFNEACHCEKDLPKAQEQPMLAEKEMAERAKYLQIADIVRENKVPIYYFVGAHNKCDLPDCEIAQKLSNVRVFRFDNAKHGMPVDKKCLRELLNLELDDLEKLFQCFEKQIIGWNAFGLKVSGAKYGVAIIYNYMKSLEKKFRQWRKSWGHAKPSGV